MIETALNFPCQGESLIGVLHRPVADARIGVVVVVGGPQYRAGSHRQFVLLGRALAAAGHACLRFDYRGMGDSSGSMRDFNDVGDDIRAAIDALQSHCPALREIVLWGLCDGASAALMYVSRDARVSAVVAVNPWVRSAESLAGARIRHYYLQRLCNVDMWRKIVSGQFEWRRSIASATASLALVARRALGARVRPKSKGASGDGTNGVQATVPFQQRMAHGWQRLRERALFVLSGNDITAQEFFDYARGDPAWQPFEAAEGNNLRRVAEADHTFSSTAWNDALIAHVLDWLACLPSAESNPAPRAAAQTAHP